MSAEMDFETTRQVLHDTKTMDFSDWTGKTVGYHLYNAGICRVRGRSYEFPGYIRFPYTLFNDTGEHLPFDLEGNLHFPTQYSLLQKGITEYHSMIRHYYWYIMEALDRPGRYWIETDEERKVRDAEKVQIAKQWALFRRENGLVLPSVQQFMDAHSVDFPNIDVNQLPTDQVVNVSIQPNELVDSNVVVANPPAANATLDELAMQNNGFGAEDQAALLREAQAEFGTQAVRNTESVDRISNVLNTPANDNQSARVSPSASDSLNPPRPIIRARRSNRNRDQGVPTAEPLMALDNQGPQVPDPGVPLRDSIREDNDTTANNDVARHENELARLSTVPEDDNEIDMPLAPMNVTDAPDVAIAPSTSNDEVNVGNRNVQNPIAMDNDEELAILQPAPENQQTPTLNPLGLPQARLSNGHATSALNVAIANLSKPRRKPRAKAKAVPEMHTPDPAEVILGLLKEHNYVWLHCLGDRPDLSYYYARIDELILENDDEPIDIKRYLDGIATAAERYKALVALTDKATDGEIYIIRVPNGPITSFRREA